MRILLVHPGPDFSVADVYRGWAEGLRENGAEVALYNTNDRLIFYSKALIRAVDKDGNEAVDEFGLPIVKSAMTQEQAILASMQGLTHACYTFWPDVVLFVSAFFVTAGVFDVMRKRGHKLVMLHTECPYQDDEQMQRGQFAHLNLLNDPSNIDAWREMGMPARYMPHAYRPEVHYPRSGPADPALASDLAFIGTAFRSRIDFFEAMDFAGIDFLLGGANWDDDLDPASPLRRYLGHTEGCVANTDTAELYRHAKCGINLYRRESEDSHQGEGWAMGPREVEMAASRLFYLRDSRPEGDEVFPMLPTFASPEDAGEQLRWWLAHDKEREDAAQQARLAVADRTFANNARNMLRELDKLH